MDMRLDRSHKLMLLFLSPDNPLWNELFGRHSRAVFHKKIIAPATQSYWRRGRTFGKYKPEEIFQKTSRMVKDLPDPEKVKRLERILRRFHKGYFSKDKGFDVYAGARCLGIPRDNALRVIDDEIYRRLSLLPTLIYDKKEPSQVDAAEADLEKYRGVYHVFARRVDSERGVLWLRAALRVRYLVTIADGYALRCKLNFPVIAPTQYREALPGSKRNESDDYFEYDGYLSQKGEGEHIFWLFEKRMEQQKRRHDYFQFITDVGRAGDNNSLSFRGTYLTVGQDVPRSIVTGDIIMERIARDEPDDEQFRGMRSAKLLTRREAHRLEELLASQKKELNRRNRRK